MVAVEDEEDTLQEATDEVGRICAAEVAMEEADLWVQGLEDVDLHLRAMVTIILQLGARASMMDLVDQQDMGEVPLRLHTPVEDHHRQGQEAMAGSLQGLLQHLVYIRGDRPQQRIWH